MIKQHMAEHKYICGDCNKEFISKCHLNRHNLNIKPCRKINDNNIICLYCNKHYSTKTILSSIYKIDRNKYLVLNWDYLGNQLYLGTLFDFYHNS